MRIIFLFFFLFSSTSAWSMGHAPGQTSESPLIGKIAPDAVLSKSDGTSASVIGSRQGKKAILIFWATWCPHCYEELSTINDQMVSSQQKGIQIILVDVGETKEDVKNYFNKRSMKLVSFIDADTVLQGPYHLIGVPTLLFIDEKGIIRNMTHQFPSDYANYFNA